METAAATTTKWAIDPSHSEIQFKVKHLMISTVTGSFKEFGAEVELEGDDLNNAQVRFWANTDSIFTNDEKRDGHLRSGDFFESGKYPKLSFTSTRIEGSGSTWKMTGDLTIKEVTRPVTLDVEWSGVAKDPWGNTKAGLNLSGKLDRKEFGLTWNAALEAGGVLVSDEVRILAEVQLAKQG
ncbi:MAG TPA: YceI family protein [Flavobacteriales bacterium]|nr:YceI family protein [Flavobacteriales bacterium]HMR29136.1 YceI family protein [Flavobacteriales bacterium]